MIGTIGMIGAGGALGAVSRYGVNLLAVRIMGHGFPWGTLAVNVAGSFVMGALIALFAHLWQPPEAVRVFFVTGFLGAFTTFSTFSLDTVALYERGELMISGLYVLASVILSIVALVAAMLLVRGITS
ncbi:MAG: fluoride efflux transporter CrcB [Alphaproteobacteria bacterium]|nr:fluoride efflux transporter CrcB [Alphaproteobacteria bacterium]